MNKALSTLTAGLGLFLLSSSAQADSNSLVTVGVGTSIGMTRAKDISASARNALSTEVNLKLKLFHVLGAEFGFTPNNPLTSDDQQLVLDSRFRLSGLLYLVPLDVVGVYAKAGIGGTQVTDLVKVTSDSNSYHAGGGLDVYIGDNVSVGAEFLVLLPGVMSIQKSIMKQALKAETAEASGDTASDGNALKDLEVSDFVSPQNFRASLSVRYFF